MQPLDNLQVFTLDSAIDLEVAFASQVLASGQGIRPYLIGGAGYYGLKLNTPNAQSDNKFGVNGWVGVLLPLSGLNAYIEARFHNVFTDVSSTQFIPVTFGILF